MIHFHSFDSRSYTSIAYSHRLSLPMRRTTDRAAERQLYYTPESYGKLNHKNHQPASYSFSFPPTEAASVTHPDFLTPQSSSSAAAIVSPLQNETQFEAMETSDLNHHPDHEEGSIRVPQHRRPTTEAPVTTLPKPPDFMELHASTTSTPPAVSSASADRWTPKPKPYYGDTVYKSNQAASLSETEKKGGLETGDGEPHSAIRSTAGSSRGSVHSSSDSRFQYSPPPPAPDEYSSDFYQNFTKDPIDWSALLLNYTKSNENFNATSLQELTHALSRPTDIAPPSSSGSSTVTAKSQKRRRYRPKASTTSTTSTSTTTTTSTTRPPRIFLQPTLDTDEDEDDDPPRNIYGDAGGDGEAAEGSHGSSSASDQEEGKESDADDRYNYPVISSPKSRTKGNYIGRPYNYHDLIATPSRSSADYQSTGSRNRNQAYNRFHRHQLHASSSDEDDESSAKYTAVRHYDPHRFPPSLYQAYYQQPPLVASDAGQGEEGMQL